MYVRDLKRSVEFYTEVMGFRVVDMTPDGFRGAAFLQAPGSTNDHDLGLFEIGTAAQDSEAGAARSGCTTSPGRSTRSTPWRRWRSS
jgi:catechol 2,3-dioxygenase-like lactoylglutathione lyase family enzyme